MREVADAISAMQHRVAEVQEDGSIALTTSYEGRQLMLYRPCSIEWLKSMGMVL